MTEYGRVQDAMALVRQLEASFKERNDLYGRLTDLIFLRDKIEIPQAYRATTMEVHAPLPFHTVKSIAAALSINPPRVRFQPTGVGDAAERNAELREKFFESSRIRQEQEAKMRLFRMFMWDVVAKGEGVLKTLERAKRAWAPYGPYARRLGTELDAEVGTGAMAQDERDRAFDRRTEEFKRTLPYPIVSAHVAPETFMYIKGESGFTLCVERKEIEYFDAAAKYSFGVDSAGRVVPEAMTTPRPHHMPILGGKKLTLLEVWDWEHCTYILQGPGDRGTEGGHIVRTLRHGYGERTTRTLRGPYFHAFGITTSSGAPEYAGVSVLFEFRELYPLLNSLLCMLYQGAYKYAFPNLREKPIPGELPNLPIGLTPPDGDQRQLPVQVGEVLHGDVDYLNPPPLGDALTQALQMGRNLVEPAMPQVLQGILDNDQSGYAVNQAQYLASLMLDPAIDNAEFALAEQVGFESWLIERRIREAVSVWGEVVGQKGKSGWLTLGPRDLKGVHRYTVKLDPKTPSNEVIRARLHQELLAQRLETWEQAVEDMGNSPVEVEQAWLLYDLKQAPAVKAQIMQRAFQALGTLDQGALGGDAAVERALFPGAAGPEPVAGAPNDAVGQVYQPGQNGMPLAPPSPGSGNLPAPEPVTPGTPARALPAPGQR